MYISISLKTNMIQTYLYISVSHHDPHGSNLHLYFQSGSTRFKHISLFQFNSDMTQAYISISNQDRYGPNLQPYFQSGSRRFKPCSNIPLYFESRSRCFKHTSLFKKERHCSNIHLYLKSRPRWFNHTPLFQTKIDMVQTNMNISTSNPDCRHSYYL